jgi:lipoate-protein ligase B
LKNNHQRFLFRDLGIKDYQRTWDLQKSLVAARAQNLLPDTILLVEHPSVFTFGRTASPQQFAVPYDKECARVGGIPVAHVDRGGGVTYHGPGQSIIYPIIALKIREQRLHWLLRCYEEIVVKTLQYFGIPGMREPGKTGVWSSKGKITSIGIGIKHWITYHGIAVNIKTNLKPFDLIHPCGLKGCKMANAASFGNEEITVNDFNSKLKATFESVWTEFWTKAPHTPVGTSTTAKKSATCTHTSQPYAQ